MTLAPSFAAVGMMGWSTPVLFSVDFRTFNVGDGSAQLAATGLSFSRALNNVGTSETVQTSDSTIVTAGLTTDVPRIGQRTASSASRGLVIEQTVKNWLLANRNLTSPPWILATPPTADAYVAADGSVIAANRCVLAPATFSNYQFFALNWGIGSGWFRSGTVVPGPFQLVIGDGAGGTLAVAGVSTAAWSRADTTTVAGASMALVPVDGRDWSAVGGIVAGARDIVADLLQLEAQPFSQVFHPTEIILSTAAVAGVRAGERLFHAAPAGLQDSGRLTLAFRMVMKGSDNEYQTLDAAGSVMLWWVDALNFVSFDVVTKRISVVVGGVTWSPVTALAWARNDTVDFFVAAGGGLLNSVAQYRVNDGVPIDLGNSGAPQGAVPATTLDFLCSGTTKEFAAWLQTLTAYRSGGGPSWI